MGSALLMKHDFREWLRDDWTHLAIVYAAVIITLSLIVQIVATVVIGRGVV